MSLSQGQFQALRAIHSLAAASGTKVYLVGGFVRDLLLGKLVGDNDVDILVDGDARIFARQCHERFGGKIRMFDSFFTAKLRGFTGFEGVEEIDFASSRTEIYERPGALPRVVLAPLEKDLRRRDFSINALAVGLGDLLQLENSIDVEKLRSRVIDQFGGIDALSTRTVAVLHDSSFTDDPTRLFRAVRYMVRLDGSLANNTERLFAEAISAKVLSTVSKERIINEIRKISLENEAGRMMALAEKKGLLAPLELFPADRSSEVMRMLIAADELKPAPEFKFTVMVRTFFSASGGKRGEDLLVWFGLGQKARYRITRGDNSGEDGALFVAAGQRAGVAFCRI